MGAEAAGEAYHVYRDGKPLRKQNSMPFTLPFSPDATRWRKTAVNDLRKLGIDVWQEGGAERVGGKERTPTFGRSPRF